VNTSLQASRWGRVKPRPPTLIFLSVILDAASTHLGLWLGLAERGPLASMLLHSLGPLYWLLESMVLLISYYIIRRSVRLPSGWATLATVTGPWLAAWSNLGYILRAGVVLHG